MYMMYRAVAVLSAALPVVACSGGGASSAGGAMSTSGQDAAPPIVVEGGSPPLGAGSAVDSAAPNIGADADTKGDACSMDSACGMDSDAMTFGSPDAGATEGSSPGSGPSSSDFVCSWVLGIHTTQEWFVAGFENIVDNARWECSGIEMAQFGWANPNSTLWQSPIDSPCTTSSKTPDRIVFTGVDSVSTTVAEFLPQYVSVVNIIKTKFPSVKRIDLMTLARAPGDMECIGANRSGSSYIKPAQDEAIAMMVAMYPGFVFATPKWEVKSCSDFTLCPHITPQANMELAKTIGDYFLTN